MNSLKRLSVDHLEVLHDAAKRKRGEVSQRAHDNDGAEDTREQQSLAPSLGIASVPPPASFGLPAGSPGRVGLVCCN